MIPLTNGGILSAEDILQETAKRYALGIDDLLGPSRVTKTRRARREWWERLRRELDMSWNEIARVVGRHPGTVRDVLTHRKRRKAVA